jgi:membrane-associated phospholipid phosphatase
MGLLQMNSNTRRGRRIGNAEGINGKRLVSWLTFCAVVGVLPIRAGADETISAKSVLEDTKLYFTAPIRWDEEDWIAFGGTLIAIGVAHQFDSKVRDHFAVGSKAILNGGEDKNSLRDAAPTAALVAGTGLYAAFIRDSDGYRETWALLEAGVFSGTTAEVLGRVGGRERPDATTSPNQWRQGGDSFPSLHVSTAFAVGTVFAESGNDEYRWIRRIIGYGVAGATAYERINENVHWLSDTVAGAALGIATAKFVLNRQDAQSHGTVQFQPVKGGWMVSYSVRTH